MNSSIIRSAAICDGKTDNWKVITTELANLGTGTLILPSGLCAISVPIVLSGTQAITLSDGAGTTIVPLKELDS